MKDCKIHILLLLSVTILTGSIMAQETEKKPQPVTMNQLQRDYYNITSLELKSDNGSLLPLGQRKEYSLIKLGITGLDGDFHRPQQAQKSTLYNFYADGAIDMKGFYLKGAFRFTQAFEKDVNFLSILNPYRGMPYMIADSTGGNWKKQFYDMWFSIASPVYWNHLSFGLRSELDLGRGAKDIDPRPQANSNNISVIPSATFEFGDHTLGGHFKYRRFMENSNLILYNSSESQKIYLMKGFGQYTYDIFSTVERERRYYGNGYGWGTQYRYSKTDVSILIHTGYENYSEEVADIEYNRPHKRGKLYETIYRAGIQASITDRLIQHIFSTTYLNTERSGREIIQVFDPSPNINTWITDSEAPRRSIVKFTTVTADYSLLTVKEMQSIYCWKFDLNVRYHNFSDEYAVMKSFCKYKSVIGNSGITRYIFINERNYVQPSAGVYYNYVWNKQKHLTERETDDRTIAQGFIAEDVAYLFQNYWRGQIGISYGHIFANHTSITVSGNYGRMFANGNLHRDLLSIWIGYNF